MSHGGTRAKTFYLIIVCTLWAIIVTCPATAGITTTGSIDPLYDGTDPWVLPSQLTVGSADASILVSGGSQVQASSTVIASGSDVPAGVTVTGTGSLWDDAGTIHVGRNGSGTMTIENGARLVAPEVFLDFGSASVGRLVVTGPGTTWEGRAIDPNWPSVFGPQGIVVGASGVGEIIVSDGARVTTNRLPTVVGWAGNGTASLTVTGPNSVWENAGYMQIGRLATGSLLISDGGTVTSTKSVVIASDSAPGSATVTGSGSTLQVGEALYVGMHGQGTMTVENGSHLIAGDVFVGSEAGSVGRLVVTGPGTIWEGDEATVFGSPSQTEIIAIIGYRGAGEAVISDGAKVTADGGTIYLGQEFGGSGSLIVTGPNSVWEGVGYMTIGYEGTGSLLISNGGTVTTTNNAGIAPNPDLGHGSATVTDPGSTWRIGGQLNVGGYMQGELLISAGGRVESRGGIIGSRVPGQHSTVTVTGPGSVWQNSDVLNIGHLGRGRLIIENGGRVTCERADVGWQSNETGGVEVRGVGSALDANWRLWIGMDGTGTLSVEDGGRITSAEAALGARGLAVVDGAGSVWSNAGMMSLAGELRIRNGGLVASEFMTTGVHSVLQGDGTLRTGTLDMWGTIRPGSSIGTLTINGAVTMEQGSVLETEIDNAGHSDKLHVVGDVNIVGGIVRAVPVGAITQSQQYTIVEANNVSGKFDAVDISLLGSVAQSRIAAFTYGADSVQLIITPFNGAALAQTPNQRALGTALQRIAEAGPTPVTELLRQVTTLDAVRAAYDQLAGQSRPALAPVAATDSARFMGIVSNRLQGARGVVANSLDRLSDSPLLAMASPDDRTGTTLTSDGSGSGLDTGRYSEDQAWGLWGKLYGLYGDRETEHGTPGYSYSVFGQSFGVDFQLTERLIGGITGGHSDGQVDYDHLADEADIDTTHAGVYGSYSADGWYLNYVATHSWLNFDTERVVDLTGERHEGDFDGYEWSGYVEAGLDWQPAASWLVQPLAGLQVSYLHLDQYAETGSFSTLVFEEQEFESYKGSLGVRVTKELALGSHGRTAIVQGRARWVHEFGDVTSSVDARFQDVPDVLFTVSDEEVSRDTILLGTGIGIRLTKGLRAFVDYDASLNPDNTAQVVSGAVEYRW